MLLAVTLVAHCSCFETLIKPTLAEDNPTGSTENVAFDTVKPVVDVEKSHLNRMVLDSNWEGKVGQDLDQMPEVLAWVKDARAAVVQPDLHLAAEDEYPLRIRRAMPLAAKAHWAVPQLITRRRK